MSNAPLGVVRRVNELTDGRNCHQPQRDRDLGAEARAVAQHQTCHAVCIETQQLQGDRAAERVSDHVQRAPLAEDVEGVEHAAREHLERGRFGCAGREPEARQIERDDPMGAGQARVLKNAQSSRLRPMPCNSSTGGRAGSPSTRTRVRHQGNWQRAEWLLRRSRLTKTLRSGGKCGR